MLPEIDLFNNSVNKFSPLSKENMLKFNRILSYKEYQKNELILRSGEIEKNIYFILKGIVKTYVLKENKEICFNFAFRGEFISSYSSFLTEKPSFINLEIISNTKLFIIPKYKLEKLYKISAESERLGRKICEHLYVKKVEREQDLLTLNATERYQKLLKRTKYIESIPIKYLASYLGLHPESLSRIRKNIS